MRRCLLPALLALAAAAGADPLRSVSWVPAAQTQGRVSYDLRRPANALHAHGALDALDALDAHAAPDAPRPRAWQLITFKVADGNRTIHVRRLVRRPGGEGAGGPPLRPLLLPAPPRGPAAPAATADLQAQATLGHAAWARPAPPSAPPSGAPAAAAGSKLAKFLSLFTVVRFANTPCAARGGAPGTCFHRLECRSMGGAAEGSCARGYGVCCVFQLSCGQRTAHNCSYFESAGWPGAAGAAAGAGAACALAVDKLPGVTQLRLDFLSFEMARPVDGTCVDQQFMVSGQNSNSIVPILCGENTGQHVYVGVDGARGPVQLAALGGGRFRVKVTQLRPGDARAAPPHCLQLLQGPSGALRSFNYAGGSYTNNLNYAICIQKEAGFCSITYFVREGNGSDTSFQMVNVDPDGEPLVPPGQAGAEAYNCPDDFVVVGGLRLCGDRFNDAAQQVDFTQNAPVTDTTSGPFVVHVRSDARVVGRGFELHYRQNPCRN